MGELTQPIATLLAETKKMPSESFRTSKRSEVPFTLRKVVHNDSRSFPEKCDFGGGKFHASFTDLNGFSRF